jgi:regulator of cell morphogenesis and NO signaling
MVAERPARARVFEELGIDYCCGGKKPLDDACEARGLDVDAVVRALVETDAAPQAEEADWTQAPISHLTDHIVRKHHDYLRQELPRLQGLVEKVVRAHSAKHPEVIELQQVFLGLSAELKAHLMKEEQVLFPMCVQMEATHSLSHSHCGSVSNPVRVMEMEHDNAGAALARIREITQDYTPPADACNTFRVMLDGLRDLEVDLHQHIHKENNILHPRVIALEHRILGDQS